MTLTEKAAYLKGFADAAKLEDKEDVAKLLGKIIDMLDDLAISVSDIDDTLDSVMEQLDAVDEDLDELEEYVYEDYDEDYDDDDFWSDDDDDDEDITYEFECPECGKTVYLDESLFESDDDIVCPACGAVLEDLTLSFDEEDEDEDDED